MPATIAPILPDERLLLLSLARKHSLRDTCPNQDPFTYGPELISIIQRSVLVEPQDGPIIIMAQIQSEQPRPRHPLINCALSALITMGHLAFIEDDMVANEHGWYNSRLVMLNN